jgi:uncharacterized membrane protein YidH (DUF202 family)
MKQDIWDTLSTSITSIYFDSRDDLTLYKDRIARIESAQLFRVRWYNTKPSGDDHIFLELKTHHEQWVLDESVKERVAIRAKDFPYILLRDGKRWTEANAEKLLLSAKPNLSGDGLASAVDLLLRIRKLIIKKNLQPCVRSSYRRLAFQSNTNNALRFTIDRDIELSSEIDAPLGHWCRTCEDANVAKVMMPVSVFEVKLNGVEAPEWVSTLLDESKILDGHKFSKYLSGASILYADKVPIFPYWAEDPIFSLYYNGADGGSETQHQSDEMMRLTQKSSNQKDIEAGTSLLSSFDGDNQINESIEEMTLSERNNRRSFLKLLNFRKRNRIQAKKKVASKDRVRVEPKTYFAAERTFIQWISAALLLITISALLFSLSETQNVEGPRFNGLILIFVATFVSIYALIVYFRRLYLMKNKKTYGYTDHFAPVILTVAVLAGIISILYHTMGEITYDHYGKGMYEVEGVCTNVSYSGISLLEFQPSDVSIDREHGLSYIASNNEILTMKLDSVDNRVRVAGGVSHGDIEGIVLVDEIIFAVSEDSMLYAFDSDSIENDAMEMVGRYV